MIYDSLEALGFYAKIIESLRHIEGMIGGREDASSSPERYDGEQEAAAFDGTLRAHKEQLCLHWVKKGREVVAVGYSEQTKGVPAGDDGTMVLEGAQVATVLTLEEGEFALFMPGEPYALRLGGSSGQLESESVRFV